MAEARAWASAAARSRLCGARRPPGGSARVLVERPPLGGQRVAAGSRHPRQARVEAFRAWRGLVHSRSPARWEIPSASATTQMTGKRHCPAPVSEERGTVKAGAGGLRAARVIVAKWTVGGFFSVAASGTGRSPAGWPAGEMRGAAVHPPSTRRGAGTTGGLACALAWPRPRQRSVSPGGRNNRSPFKPSPCRCAVPFSPSRVPGRPLVAAETPAPGAPGALRRSPGQRAAGGACACAAWAPACRACCWTAANCRPPPCGARRRRLRRLDRRGRQRSAGWSRAAQQSG